MWVETDEALKARDLRRQRPLKTEQETYPRACNWGVGGMQRREPYSQSQAAVPCPPAQSFVHRVIETSIVRRRGFDDTDVGKQTNL